MVSVDVKLHWTVVSRSSGAVWKSRSPSWVPVSNKLTVSVDVKQHFNQPTSTNRQRVCRDSVTGPNPNQHPGDSKTGQPWTNRGKTQLQNTSNTTIVTQENEQASSLMMSVLVVNQWGLRRLWTSEVYTGCELMGYVPLVNQWGLYRLRINEVCSGCEPVSYIPVVNQWGLCRLWTNEVCAGCEPMRSIQVVDQWGLFRLWTSEVYAGCEPMIYSGCEPVRSMPVLNQWCLCRLWTNGVSTKNTEMAYIRPKATEKTNKKSTTLKHETERKKKTKKVGQNHKPNSKGVEASSLEIRTGHFSKSVTLRTPLQNNK